MKFWKCCIFSLICVFISGCSTETIFTSYPDKMSNNLNQINQGQFEQCIKQLTTAQKSNDYELYAAELGRIQQLSFNYSGSTSTFMPLMVKVQADELQAKIRGSHILATTGSMLTNDNAIPYQLASYEVVFLYQYQALNFIAEGDIANALVAARKSNELQVYLAQEYQQELAAAQEQAQKSNINLQTLNDHNAQLQSTLAVAASVKNSFANAMSYYLSGLLFLATNDLNNAAVAMQQAISIMPQNSYLQTMLLTTLQVQGAPPATIANYQKAFGLQALPKPAQNKAHVTVMYEQNFVNARIPVSFSIPLPGTGSGAQIFSFPAYSKSSTPITPLNVSDGTESLADTQLMVNTNALAAKDLEQQYPIIFVREALRVLTKAAMVEAAQQSSNNQNQNNFAAALVGLYGAFTDRPDLRSWLTLPQDIQIAQYDLKPGNYQFHLSNGGLSTDISQELDAHHYYLIWVAQYGKELKAQIFEL